MRSTLCDMWRSAGGTMEERCTSSQRHGNPERCGVIEGVGTGREVLALFLEHLPDCPVRLLGMAMQPLWKPAPSALVLIWNSSLPVVPISARPEKPVWNKRLAVSPAAALFSFS